MSTLWQARNPSPHSELVQRSQVTPRALHLATWFFASSATAPSDILLEARGTRTIPSQCPFIRLVKDGALAFLTNGETLDLSSLTIFCVVPATGSFYFDVGTDSISPIDIAVYPAETGHCDLFPVTSGCYSYRTDWPLEDRIDAASTRKTDCYSALLATCENNGWHATHFPVEVGSRGWVAHSLPTCLQKLGFAASWRKKVRRECSRVAPRCSYLLYLRRSIHTWNSFNELSTLNQAQVARTIKRLRIFPEGSPWSTPV